MGENLLCIRIVDNSCGHFFVIHILNYSTLTEFKTQIIALSRCLKLIWSTLLPLTQKRAHFINVDAIVDIFLSGNLANSDCLTTLIRSLRFHRVLSILFHLCGFVLVRISRLLLFQCC